MTERIGIWIEATCPRFLHPLWLRFRASPLWVRLARGVFWSLVGAVLARGLGVASSIIVARALGIAAFGEFTMIQSTVGLFGTFAGLGLGVTVTKYVAELRESDPVRCGRVIGLILLVATAGALWLAPACCCSPRGWRRTRWLRPNWLLSSKPARHWCSAILCKAFMRGPWPASRPS